jgi:chemosensory pili system protein ChpC
MSGDQKELYSLLIPLRAERLLVPRMCVAEVIAFADMERRRDEDVPEWLLGTIDWNGRRLPVVSFDRVEPAEQPKSRKKPSRTRIVVFHALTNRLKNGYFGILTQGFPQLVRVNPDVVSLDRDTPVPRGLPVLCRVRMIHEFPLIPDVDRLEGMVAEHLDAVV